MILNALKVMSGLGDSVPLISPAVLEPVINMKTDYLGNRSPRLRTDEILVALSVSAATSPSAEIALKMLPGLRGCEAHSTMILPSAEEDVLRKLGISITCDPYYPTSKLYHG
jgi:uncharacterized protein (UPF0371 family)